METVGIKPNETSVYEHFLDSIRFDGHKYVVKLPFRESAPLLPDNYQLSVKHLNSMSSRLRKQHELLKEYDEIVRNQTEKGILEDVDPNASTVVSETLSPTAPGNQG